MSATREIELGKLRLGAGNPLFLIAGHYGGKDRQDRG